MAETTPQRLQDSLVHPDDEALRLNVRLIMSETDFYDESLPIDVVRGLLSPVVDNFFILIKGKQQIPGAKGHFLQTSFIREVILLNDLPEERVVR